jgi:hypothetical protein
VAGAGSYLAFNAGRFASKDLSADLSAKYDRFARWYDILEGVLGFFGATNLDEKHSQRVPVQSLKSPLEPERNSLTNEVIARSLP